MSAARTCPLHPTRHAPAINIGYAGRARDHAPIGFPIVTADSLESEQLRRAGANRSETVTAGLYESHP